MLYLVMTNLIYIVLSSLFIRMQFIARYLQSMLSVPNKRILPDYI